MNTPISKTESNVIDVATGEVKAVRAPAQLQCLALGSCVAVILYDKKRKIGGIAHVMLPSSMSINTRNVDALKHANHAIRELIKQLQELGADKGVLTAYLVGGALVISGVSDIGKENISAIRHALQELGIRVIDEHLGGTAGRSVLFNVATGELQINGNVITSEAAQFSPTDKKGLEERIAGRTRNGEETKVGVEKNIHIRSLPIIERKEICQNTVEVSFGLEESGVTFEAGQYIRVTLPKLFYPDPRGNYRDFSIASSPDDKKALRIAMRQSDSGFKKTLVETAIGSRVKITGPFGVFTLPKDTAHSIVFVAGGIGITPFLSKIRFAVENKLDQKITLIYANINKEEAAYLDELKELVKKHPRITLKSIFGAVTREHIRESIPDLFPSIWQIGGPPAMDIAVRNILLDLGVKADRIFIEEFIGYDSGTSIPASATRSFNLEKNKSTQVLMDLLDQSALVSATDAEGTIVYTNDRFVEVSKYSREDLIGQNHRVVKSGYHPPLFYNDLWTTISGGKVWRGELKNLAKDGSFYWVDTTIRPVFDEHGKIINYVSFRFVITERKEAEARLQGRAEELEDAQKATTNLLEDLETEREKLSLEKAKDEALLASIGDGVIAADVDGRIILMNPSAREMLGWHIENMSGRLLYDAIQIEDEKGNLVPREKRPMALALKGSSFSAAAMGPSYYYIRKDKTKFPVAIVVTPVAIDKKIIGAVEVFRDITKEKEIDQAKSDFISMASHQLRTPMTSIQWVIERFLKTEQPTQKGKAYLEDIHGAVRRLSSLVDLLLNVSRIEAGKVGAAPKPLELVSFVKMYLKECAPLVAKKRLRVIFEEHPSTFNVITDHITLRNILHSLVSNALEYTFDGGEVEIAIAKKNSAFVIAVRDTGIGIPKEEQSHIFEKFFRASNAKLVKTDGTGLGLYIAAQATKMLRGSIWVESEMDKGSTFSVELPIESEPVAGEQSMT